jgi:murein DD-endopeptidase MepM/ murein hydrolase activator NlpD
MASESIATAPTGAKCAAAKRSTTNTARQDGTTSVTPLNAHLTDLTDLTVTGNFVVESQVGCYVAHNGDAPWLLSHGRFDPDAFGLDEAAGDTAPDLSVDPDSMVLSVINGSHDTTLSYFITVEHTVLIRSLDRGGPHRRGGAGAGSAEDGSGAGGGGGGGGPAAVDFASDASDAGTDDGLVEAGHTPATFVLVLKPRTTADVCRIVLTDDPTDQAGEPVEIELRLTSDIKEVDPVDLIDRFDVAHTYDFPLGPGGPYLCSQGVGGSFTHFYPGTYHAIDFECPVGTAVLAVGDGTIVEVQQENSVTGCHVSNLFQWNSVMIRLNDGVYVEYVHIRRNSCLVRAGDAVRRGDKICETGDVGFCPSPHLHIQMHESSDKDAPTIMFALRSSSGGGAFIPEAGKRYG